MPRWLARLLRRRTKVVFLHIPKCGGTSLHVSLSKAFAPKHICPERHTLDRWTPQELERYRFFSGHFSYSSLAKIPGRKAVVTMFREPREQLLSSYYFIKSSKYEELHRRDPKLLEVKALSLTEYLRAGAPYRPSAIGQIGGGDIATAIDRLSEFAAIGLLEHSDISTNRIFGTLGLSPPAGGLPHKMAFSDLTKYVTMEPTPVTREPITDEITALLTEITTEDRILYGAAVERFHRA